MVPISKNLSNLLIELKNIGPFKETLKGLNGFSDHFEDLVLPRIPEWRYGQAAQVTKTFCRRIGITEVSFHCLRSVFITNLLSQGVALPVVMSIVGHSKTSTTDEYLRLAGVNVKGATEKLSYQLPQENNKNILNFN